MRLNDRVAMITGGGSGIGKATALLFAHEGAKVAVVDMDPAAGQQVASEIGERGGDALFVSADLTREAEVKRAVAEAVAFIVGGAVGGAIKGGVLVWLLRQPAPPDGEADEQPKVEEQSAE